MRKILLAVAVKPLRHGHEWFAADTWGHHALKTYALTMLGEKSEALQELPRPVLDDDLGPIGNWLLAEALVMFGRPNGFAVDRSLHPQRFNRQEFVDEWRKTSRRGRSASQGKSRRHEAQRFSAQAAR